MKNLFTILFLVCIGGLIAQPTITYSALPTTGTVKITYADTFGTNLWVDSSGINKTWDYSGDFTVHAQSLDSFRSSSLAMHTTIFPSAGLYTPAGGNWESFYRTDSTGYYFDGMSTGSLMTLDSDPDELLMPVPFDYLSTTQDSSYIKLEVGFGNYVSTYMNKTFQADAYGQLTTPVGTFNDALRIKISYEGRDSSVASFPVNSITVSDSSWTKYIWVQNSNNLFLMSIDLDQNGIISGGEYYSGNSITTNIIETEASNKVRLFPNPSSSTINWSLDINSGEILIFDVNGKELKRLVVKNNTPKMDISSFANGLYLYKLYNNKGNEVYAGEIIKQ